jgi:hypothetical protein
MVQKRVEKMLICHQYQKLRGLILLRGGRFFKHQQCNFVHGKQGGQAGRTFLRCLMTWMSQTLLFW